MARARLYCIFVLLLYSQGLHGQQQLCNNQNIGANNAVGLQQQSLQRTGNNANQIPNGGMNINVAQPNLQQANQQPPTQQLPGQGNRQQQLNMPPNLQQQTAPQNNFQFTKIGFTPVTPGMTHPGSIQQCQNPSINANVQVSQPQNNQPIMNNPIGISNAQSMSTLAELAALKGQPSLLSMLNPQNIGQQNQQMVSNALPAYNQLTDAQKQYLVRSLQAQNQQGINVVQTQQNIGNLDNQQGISVRTIQSVPQQGQAIITPLGNQPPYITVQAKPLAAYVANQTPQVVVEEEPSILSMILSELGPQYGITAALPPKTGSKTSLKTLLPIIINLLKDRNNCGCRNCGCPNPCQNSGGPNTLPEEQIAQIFSGYSNQKIYGQELDDSASRIKKNDNELSRNIDKDKNDNKKKPVVLDSEEDSEENYSEYHDEGDE